MADDKRGADKGGKRRRPTTIDLKATEIVSEPVKPAERVEITPETPREPAPERPPQAAAPPPPEPPSGSAPKAGDWPPEWLNLAAMNERFSNLRERFDWRLLGAGAAGATVMFLLFIAAWAMGAFSPRDELSVTLAARMVLFESQLRDLAARPQPPGLDQRALADFGARVGAAENAMGRLADVEARLAKAEQGLTKAEQTAATPRPPQTDQALTARVAALEAATRPLAELSSRIDAAGSAARDAKARADAAFESAQKGAAIPAAQAADHKEIEALAKRVAALEQTAKGIEDRIARAAASAGADRAGRLAFAAMALRGLAERGEPFAQELTAVRGLVPDGKVLAPLEPFAASGVPRAPALARELSQLTGAMLAAAGSAPRDGGFLDKLQQNAEKLVRIRPINETPGDDPATVIARADVKATHGDLSAALAELKGLPPAVRAPAENWITRVQARDAALVAARDLADGAVGALAKSGL